MIYTSLKSLVNSTPACTNAGKVCCTHLPFFNPAGIKVHEKTGIINESVRNLFLIDTMQRNLCRAVVVGN